MLILFTLFGADKSMNATLNFLPSKSLKCCFSLFARWIPCLRKFLRGQIIETFSVGFISVIFLSVFRVDFVLIIGIITGLAI